MCFQVLEGRVQHRWFHYSKQLFNSPCLVQVVLDSGLPEMDSGTPIVYAVEDFKTIKLNS